MTQAADSAGRPLDLPDRRQFWQWVWSSIRPVVGWTLALAGAVALFVGWWGVSGEALTAKQIPYLVSAGLTGVALFILAGVFLATDDVRRQFERIGELERKVDDLYALFVADLASAEHAAAERAAGGSGRHATATLPVTPPGTSHLVALPTGSSYHLPGCALVTGKEAATPVDAETVRRRGLAPCRVCAPPPAG